MASFPFDSAAMLAEIIIPMTEAMAREVMDAAILSKDGYSSCAIYYIDKDQKRQSVRVSVIVDTDSHYNYYGYCDEYHPRKDGKAEFIYK